MCKCRIISEETKQVLRLSLTEFSLPKFYLLFGISKVKSAAVIAFRSSYRDRSFSPGSYERETFALSSLETVTEALLEIMEVRRVDIFLEENPVGTQPLMSDVKLYSFDVKLFFGGNILPGVVFPPGVYEGHPILQVVGSVDRAGSEV